MAAIAGSKRLADRRDRAHSGLTARDYLRIAVEAGCAVKTAKLILSDEEAKRRARATTVSCIERAAKKLGLNTGTWVR